MSEACAPSAGGDANEEEVRAALPFGDAYDAEFDTEEEAVAELRRCGVAVSDQMRRTLRGKGSVTVPVPIADPSRMFAAFKALEKHAQEHPKAPSDVTEEDLAAAPDGAWLHGVAAQVALSAFESDAGRRGLVRSQLTSMMLTFRDYDFGDE